MNIQTLKIELQKKIAKMNYRDFNNLIDELKRMYYKAHKHNMREHIDE